jgi:NADPH-dependent 2,4-dienoyl-CoA reductase/sulfur reductase-like enzyme
MVLADAYPNFSICGLPYYVSGDVPDWRSLAHRTRAEIEGAGIHLLMETTALAIAPQEQIVRLRPAQGDAFSLSYDRLIIATGATPRHPAIHGLDALLAPDTADALHAVSGAQPERTPHTGESGVYLLHTMEQSFAVHRHLEQHPPRRAVIVGGGYISLEMAEALTTRGIPTTILQRPAQLHPSVDPELGARLAATLVLHGVEVETGVDVTEVARVDGRSGDGSHLVIRGRATAVPTEELDRHWAADLVLVATGVQPATSITQATGMRLGVAGAIRVTRGMETSVPGILAAGDCVETHHRLLPAPTYLPLGTTAHKQGRIAGENAVGGRAQFAGTVGTQAVKVFECVVARTGLLEAEARTAGYDPLTIELTTWDHKVYYPGAHALVVRLTGDFQSGLLLGAQLLGRWRDEVSKRVDIAASALYQGLRVDQLNELDLSYTPPLSSPWDPLQMAAQEWQAELARLAPPVFVGRPRGD